MAALYELTGAYKKLMDASVDYETGEVDESAVPEFATILAQLEGDLNTKIDGCARALKMMDVDIASMKAEEERLFKRRKSIEKSKEHLRGYMVGCLEHAGIPKIKTHLFTVYTQKPKDSVEIFDESAIPMGYRKVLGPPPPDKTLIGDALRAGKLVEGARIVVGQPVLVVR